MTVLLSLTYVFVGGKFNSSRDRMGVPSFFIAHNPSPVQEQRGKRAAKAGFLLESNRVILRPAGFIPDHNS
jgi:hypothetical protein